MSEALLYICNFSDTKDPGSSYVSEFILQWWKALTGKLRKESLCLDHNNSTITELPEFHNLCKNKTLTTLSAGIEMQFSDIEMLHKKEIWYADLSGSSLKVAVTSESKKLSFLY